MSIPRRVAALVLALASSSFAQTTQPARLSAPEVNNAILTELAAQIVIVCDVPGIAIAVVDAGGIRALGVAGVRAVGSAERLQPDDKFHIGSCGKAMTAGLILRLREQGKLDLDAPITRYLPDVKADDAWKSVTLRHLLQHRGGFSHEADFEQLPFLRVARTPEQGRSSLAERVLAKPPTGKVGTFDYSNIGYTLAGHIAEVAGGASYEQLMREEVFRPLGMATAGFGPPATPTTTPANPPGETEKLDQPLGHSPATRPIAVGVLADNPAALAPAGTMHMSLRDWARFSAAVLSPGEQGWLSRDSIALLSTPPESADGSDQNPRYALGFGITDTRNQRTLTHAGSNTLWFAQILLLPDSGWGILVATNIAGNAGPMATQEAIKELIRTAR
jgi:D-alanyl-D-alanine carboxypeptidase